MAGERSATLRFAHRRGAGPKSPPSPLCPRVGGYRVPVTVSPACTGLPSCAECGACEQHDTSSCRAARHMPRMLHALHAAVSCHPLQTAHPPPITQLETSWRGQDCVCRRRDFSLWPAWGGALARRPTGRATCGPLRLALRPDVYPGGHLQQALRVQGRRRMLVPGGTDVGWRAVWGQPCPHAPRRSLRSAVGRAVFYFGLCAAPLGSDFLHAPCRLLRRFSSSWEARKVIPPGLRQGLGACALPMARHGSPP